MLDFGLVSNKRPKPTLQVACVLGAFRVHRAPLLLSSWMLTSAVGSRVGRKWEGVKDKRERNGFHLYIQLYEDPKCLPDFSFP